MTMWPSLSVRVSQSKRTGALAVRSPLGEQTFDSSFQRLGHAAAQELFEQAEIGVDGDVGVAHGHGAFDGRAQQAHGGVEGKHEGAALPFALFVGDLDGNHWRALEKIVKGTVDSLDDLLF